MSSENSSSEAAHNANLCVICCQTVECFALGRCDHPVCYQCGVRMRVLCKENICSVCRTDLKQLVIIKDPQPFSKVNFKSLPKDRKTGIFFDCDEARELVDKLLEHKCTLCKERPPDKTFNQLQDHMKKHHSLFYCEICVDHLKLFTHEKKCYTRKQLATHRRTGDSDDKSHKGHPLCEFCDIRFLDNDELMLHLRKNHLWCHFCEKDGKQDYYCDYDSLREHFRDSHFLCEEDDCLHEKFTSVFRTQIDYQAHKASRHSKSMSKAVARQNRQLEVDINYTRRPVNQMNTYTRETRGPSRREPRGQNKDGNRGTLGGSDARVHAREAENIQIAMAQSLTLSASDRSKKPDPKQKRTKKVKPEFQTKTPDNHQTVKEESITNPVLQQPSRETGVPGPIQKKSLDEDVVMTDKTPISSHKVEDDFPSLSSGSRQTVPPAVQSDGGNSFRMTLSQEADFPSLSNNAKQPRQLNNPSVPVSCKFVSNTLKRAEGDFPSLPSDGQATPQPLESYGKKFSKALKLTEQEYPNLKSQPKSSLKSKQVFNVREFPTLSDNPSTSRPAPPPGFSNKRPPPGLVQQTKPPSPPPGLRRQAASAIPNQNNTAPAVLLDPPEYSLPNNYQERNKVLIKTIQGLLGQDKFMQFKTLSGEFRQDHRSASEYYNACCSLFGANMQKIFQELVALLPDPLKQQQLLTAHSDAKALAKQNGEKVIKIGDKKIDTATPWQNVDNFRSCPYCKQFLSPKDWDGHLAGHAAEQEFPSLSAAHSVRAPPGIKTGPTKIAWVKGK